MIFTTNNLRTRAVAMNLANTKTREEAAESNDAQLPPGKYSVGVTVNIQAEFTVTPEGLIVDRKVQTVFPSVLNSEANPGIMLANTGVRSF